MGFELTEHSAREERSGQRKSSEDTQSALNTEQQMCARKLPKAGERMNHRYENE